MKKNQARAGVWLLLLMMVQLSAFAQHSITGQIENQQQLPIAAASVEVWKETQPVQKAIANDSGCFQLSGLAPAWFVSIENNSGWLSGEAFGFYPHSRNRNALSYNTQYGVWAVEPDNNKG